MRGVHTQLKPLLKVVPKGGGLIPGVPQWLFVFSLPKWVHTNLDL